MATSKKSQRETNPSVLKTAMLKRLPRRSSATGQILWPAVPALAEYYTQQLHTIFAALGRNFSPDEMKKVRAILESKLKDGFDASPYSKVCVDYYTEPPPNTALTYTISHRVITIGDEYESWVKTRKPPLFGAYPDEKALALAKSLGEPSAVTILDVGAGTGRNTIPLSLAGYPTDAVELAPALAAVLREAVATANAPIRVFEGDALDPALEIPKHHYKLLFLAEVVASHFRSVEHVRRLFERSLELLEPGGLLCFSVFLAGSGYKPEALSREMGGALWCPVFTRGDMEVASAGLPFTRLTDESVHDFEKEHMDPSHWPPTGWFPDWTRGLDLFDLAVEKSPLDLRWLVYRKE
jgi:SAM-dependent methyltransferase